MQNSDSDSAIADYLLAVCAARLDDAAGVRKHIRAAIDKDASLRNRALSDLEFRNHKECPHQLRPSRLTPIEKARPVGRAFCCCMLTQACLK